MLLHKNVIADLEKVSNKEKAEFLPRFFKCGKGEYGEGDIFLGVVVPAQRIIAKKYSALSLVEIKKLLGSLFHEARLTALLILVEQFAKADAKQKKIIHNFYLKNTKKINNWDLVDLSAPKIVSAYLLENKAERKILYKLAKSKNLWERRIAIIGTYAFIRAMQFENTFKISEILLKDKHDLIHKAVGWMLREVGNRDLSAEEKFLQKHYKMMPRAMLRYAIEKFPEQKRLSYLKNKI
jgi:3-methyladenine DNA glycosylase AlkD